ncbi:alginate export family protein [Oceanobacter kriegii]|uniref:hypothetical protein n=1 Tax=Oceanobacter kriegii TaxID=64972 RepID=UPI0004126B3C|nr:hypothetical protein [Oceanobacter kriegii]
MKEMRITPLAAALAAAICQPALAQTQSDAFEITPSLAASAAHIQASNANFGAGRFDIQEGQPDGQDSQWTEVFVKPGAVARYTVAPSFSLSAGLSAVATKTLGDGDAGGFTNDKNGDVDLEEAWLGVNYDNWSLTAGRQSYMIGSGFIVMDGNLDMFDDGAYWLGPRTAFKASAVLAYESEPFSAELFSLGVDKDLGAFRMNGANLDVPFNDGTLGASLIKVKAGSADGLKVVNLRALQQAIPAIDGLMVSAEYAKQTGEGSGVKYDANAWYLTTDYHFGDVGQSPMISYRYAAFSGDDDPSDNTVKSWNALAKGYVDWGTWLIGDIAGNYLIYNSNEQVHTLRASYGLQPNLILGALNHRIYLDQKNFDSGTGASAVSSTAFANETAVYLDWFPNQQTYVSLAYNLTKPLSAAKQTLGDDTMSALELYLAWNY